MPLAVGKTASKRQRKNEALKGIHSLVYGEIELDSFALVLHKVTYTINGVRRIWDSWLLICDHFHC